ncbi:glycosyltransferase family protein [Mucilaginibacter ginsenosidivorans]|uniref:glycosyltransferase n=1 Tax=Mucilaginibacter ginsenosidivorans TaxID=398053 RepID=UPI001E3FF471|nr:glycosyltransferase [Mucilaginibacter ginsenosidivorans]
MANDEVLNDIAAAFASQETDVLYGDLDFIDPDGNIVRKWRPGAYKYGKFNWGWMPPHPTFYCKRTLFERLGGYRLDYGSAADYELMLRFIHVGRARVSYLRKVIVKMYIGGVSNKNLSNRLQAARFDVKAMQTNGILFPYIALIFKPLRKLIQFF